MSKTSNCLKLLEILKSVDFITSRNIASILNINKRNIIEYIKELIDCGYIIESVIGTNGGYHYVGKKEDIPSSDSKFIESFAKAIEGYNKLNVYYYNYNQAKEHALFHPYSFFNSEESSSIYGFDEVSNSFIYIRLDLIYELSISLEHFTKRKH